MQKGERLRFPRVPSQRGAGRRSATAQTGEFRFCERLSVYFYLGRPDSFAPAKSGTFAPPFLSLLRERKRRAAVEREAACGRVAPPVLPASVEATELTMSYRNSSTASLAWQNAHPGRLELIFGRAMFVYRKPGINLQSARGRILEAWENPLAGIKVPCKFK